MPHQNLSSNLFNDGHLSELNLFILDRLARKTKKPNKWNSDEFHSKNHSWASSHQDDQYLRDRCQHKNRCFRGDWRWVCVSAGVILTHPVGVNLTHLGNDGGFLAT